MALRVQILSDLHFEFDADGGEAFAREVPVAGDALVLAGDLLPLLSVETVTRALGWFCARFPHVVYLPGNHEYYGTRPAAAEAVLARSAETFANLHVLNPDVATIAGQRFVGAPLWFPGPSADEARLRWCVSDFSLISDFVPWVHETHAAHLAFLAANLRPGDVAVTHHLPHPRSVAPQFARSSLNRFFLAEDAAELVERAGARLWVHGHTHTPCDYVVGASGEGGDAGGGETRVICNPRGYPGARARAFDSGLAVRV